MQTDSKEIDTDGDPYRYTKVMPLLPGDVLDQHHYMLLYHYMEQYFGIDKDSEVICPGDSRYEIFIRIHTFDYEGKNALKEFNDLMDVVYVPEDVSDHNIQVDHADNDKFNGNRAAQTDYIATGITQSKTVHAENAAGSKEHAE